MASIGDALAAAIQLQQAGDLRAAEKAYWKILKQDPGNADALHLLGTIAHQVGKHDLAVDLIRRAVAINPASANFHANLGRVYLSLGKFDEVIASSELALQLQPDLIAAQLNMGIALRNQGRSEEAAACAQRALQLNPQFVIAHISLGNAFRDLGKLDAAIAAFRRALDIEPANATAHRNLAMSLLATGNFEMGWEEYEWRRETHKLSSQDFQQPIWDGGPVSGRILIHAEQGLGDTIQFVRYLPLVKPLVETVVFQCQRPLMTLLRHVAGADQIVAEGEELPAFDRVCPLMSLPRLFHTTLETIPAGIPYLAVDPALIQSWRQKLATYHGARDRFQIGICWQGSPHRSRDRLRSIPLGCFAALARQPGVSLISLQKGDGLDQLQLPGCEFPLLDLSATLDEQSGPFVDTAAVMMNLDLVVTCDTAIAHLAGALGVPVWLLASYAADWRWLVEREDSPWYPTMRIFRQSKTADWEGVFRQVEAALARMVQERSSAKEGS